MDLFLCVIYRDDNEWLRYRKVLNPMLLQNFNHYKLAIETACDELIDGINDDDKIVANRQDKSLRDTEFVEWRDLEVRLYRWSIDGKWVHVAEKFNSGPHFWRPLSPKAKSSLLGLLVTS